jgi:hypothetical protein
MIYTQSVVLPVMIEPCAQVIPGFREKFEPAFAKWKQARATEIDRGYRVLSDEARKEGTDLAKWTESLKKEGLEVMRRHSEDRRRSTCETNLNSLR